MSSGTIKKLTEKGFGFIQVDDENSDLFFHMSSLQGIQFHELKEGQRVQFTKGNGPKGPRAEDVRVA